MGNSHFASYLHIFLFKKKIAEINLNYQKIQKGLFRPLHIFINYLPLLQTKTENEKTLE